jgi:ATP-dependent Lon protease
VDLDLSGALFVFSLNDISRVPSVLRDRLEFVHMDPPTEESLRIIVRDHLLPQALQRAATASDAVVLEEEALTALARLAQSRGVRTALRAVDALCVRSAAVLQGCAETLLPPVPADQLLLADGACRVRAGAVRALERELQGRESVEWRRMYA